MARWSASSGELPQPHLPAKQDVGGRHVRSFVRVLGRRPQPGPQESHLETLEQRSLSCQQEWDRPPCDIPKPEPCHCQSRRPGCVAPAVHVSWQGHSPGRVLQWPKTSCWLYWGCHLAASGALGIATWDALWEPRWRTPWLQVVRLWEGTHQCERPVLRDQSRGAEQTPRYPPWQPL